MHVAEVVGEASNAAEGHCNRGPPPSLPKLRYMKV